MRLSVRQLMRIHQGASLSWHWSAGIWQLLRREGLHVNHKQVYRIHSSLDYQTPAEFATDWRNRKYEEKPTYITN